MNKYKKPLFIGLIVLDVAITVFLFIISIMILAVVVPADTITDAINNSTGLIKYLLQNSTIYLVLFVIPLFLILAANIVGLVFYVRKTAEKEKVKLHDLSEEEKEALRQELLKDLQKGSSDK
ncbi:MAG: hypothetical protein GXY27_05395 [Erysipelotrichaceae bacterium]|nr:hypothetical protein [Erysipelotrichaceae bacterium]